MFREKIFFPRSRLKENMIWRRMKAASRDNSGIQLVFERVKLLVSTRLPLVNEWASCSHPNKCSCGWGVNILCMTSTHSFLACLMFFFPEFIDWVVRLPSANHSGAKSLGNTSFILFISS